MPNTVKISAELSGLFESAQKDLARLTKSGGLKIPVNDKAFNTAVGGMTTNLRRFEQSLDFSNRRVIAFGTSASIVYGTVRAFTELVKATIDVEKSLTSINAIFQLSNRQIDTFGKGLFDVARQTGQAFDEVAKAAEEFSRQGLSVDETLKRTRDAMILVRLTGLDAAKAVDTLTAAVNTYGRAGEDTTSILNKLVAVDQRFAVSTRDLAEAFQRVGSTAQDAGVSIDEFAGLVTAAKQITSREGGVIGNSLKTIFTRLERSSTIDQLDALGVSVRDAAGNALPAIKVFEALARSYKGFSRDQQQQVAELGSGVFQINQFKALLSDLGKADGIYSQARKTAASGANEALIRNAALNDTLATSIQNLKTSAVQAASVVGSLAIKPLLLQGVEGGNLIAGLFKNAKASGDTKASEDFGAYVAESILKGIGNTLLGPGLVFIGRAIVGVIKRTVPEIAGDIKASANLFNPGSRPNAFSAALQPTGEADAISRTNALVAQGTTEEQKRYLAAKTVAEQEAAILAILERQALVTAELAGIQRGTASKIAAQEAALAGVTVGKAKTAYRPGAAGGYLPIGEEMSAVARGVGGAPSSAQAVYLPDFNRGGGQRGIVANTSEWKVPGSAGGAIFNRDMIARFGLPPGSTPVAAGGFVPQHGYGGDTYDYSAESAAYIGAQQKAAAQRALDEARQRAADYERAQKEIADKEVATQRRLEDIAKQRAADLEKGFRLLEKERTLATSKGQLTEKEIKTSESVLGATQGLYEQARARGQALGISRESTPLSSTFYANKAINPLGGVIPYGPPSPSSIQLALANARFITSDTQRAGGPGSIIESRPWSGLPYVNTDINGRPIPRASDPNALAAPTVRETQRRNQLRAIADAEEARRLAQRTQITSDLTAQERYTRRASRANTLQNGLLIGSLASGFIPQGQSGTLGGQIGGAASGGLQGGAFGSFIGSLAGPMGTFIGAIVGGLGGALKGFIDRSQKSFEELSNDINESNSKLKQEMEAVTRAFDLQDQILEGRANGISKDGLVRLQRAFAQTTSQIKDKRLLELVLGGAGNPDARAQAAKIGEDRATPKLIQDAIQLTFSKAIGSTYGLGTPSREETTSATDALKARFSTMSDKDLAAELSRVRNPAAAAADAEARGGKSFFTRLQESNLGVAFAGSTSSAPLGLGLGLLSQRAKATAGAFNQDATIGAITGILEERRIKAAIDEAERKATGPRPILRPEALALSARIGLSGQLGQVSSDAAQRIRQTQQQIALEGPEVTDVGRLLRSGLFGRENIIAQIGTQRESALAAGKAGLIQSLEGAGVKSRELIENRVGGATGVDDLRRLLGDLSAGSSLLAGSKNPNETLDQTRIALKDLIARITVLNATEEASIKVNDETNKLLVDQLTYRKTPEGAFRYLRGSLRESEDASRITDQAVVNVARSREGHALVTGDTLTNALYGQAGRLGRAGQSTDSFTGGFKSVFAGARQDILQFADVGHQVASSLRDDLSGAFGEFVIGAKKGKEAFRDFAVSIASDAARAFGSKAVTSLLGLLLGNIGKLITPTVSVGTPTVVSEPPLNVATGGPILRRASGGTIPTLLTGGEYVFSPEQASRIGGRRLGAINSGAMRTFAPGGLVHGGSGVRDDVYQSLAEGSYVVKKASVARYGANNLATLAIGGYPETAPMMGMPLLRDNGGPIASMMPIPTPSATMPVVGGGAFHIGVTINDNSTTSSSSSSTSNGSPLADRHFGETLARRMKEVALQTIQEQQRGGGILMRTARG